jgi:transcriptional regulator with XRE-family HTH domain
VPTDDQPEWIRHHRREVGERIRATRKRTDLTQEQLAERMGIDSKTISRAENGIYAISLDQLARIAWALDVPSARLLPDERPPGPARG